LTWQASAARGDWGAIAVSLPCLRAALAERDALGWRQRRELRLANEFVCTRRHGPKVRERRLCVRLVLEGAPHQGLALGDRARASLLVDLRKQEPARRIAAAKSDHVAQERQCGAFLLIGADDAARIQVPQLINHGPYPTALGMERSSVERRFTLEALCFYRVGREDAATRLPNRSISRAVHR
jgi:hypothetical protein